MATVTVTRNTSNAYEQHVNPQWVRLLDLLDMNRQYETCNGAELTTVDGQVIYDFLSGYCVYNTGHNHPEIIAALKEELDRRGPSMLQSHVPELAGELAERLCKLAGGNMRRVFFPSSGSEGIETAIKFARAATGRPGILYAQDGFHGLTCGALSLMSNSFWTDRFGPFIPGTEAVRFEDTRQLELKLRTREFAAFICEPIQAEAGIRVPSREYMQEVQSLCRRYGTLFVLDEVQTGFYRTGPFLASQHFGVEPDMVILAKALSGGLVPAAAVLMTERISDSVYDSLKHAFVHASTFSENSLSMRAGLATIDVLEKEQLGNRATALGDDLRLKLRARLSRYEMFKEVRGVGLLCGIEFQPPRQFALRLPFQAFKQIHPGMFGQMVVRNLFREHSILTQICGNNFMVLKAAPPLVCSTRHVDIFVEAMDRVMQDVHASGAFWAEALKLARRAVTI
jgi:ornithine--oxo-acid transaminase